MKSPDISPKNGIILTLLIVVLLICLVKSAWIQDDAYITFRTVDNFVHGYGLTWNIEERVQAYTHPLWMFVITAAYLLTGEVYYTCIVVALLITVLAAVLLAFRLSAGPLTAVFAVTALVASKPFVDFSTSGLENPLSHLILILFFLVYFRLEGDWWAERTSPKYDRFFWLALLAALAVLNRPDTILVYAPMLAYCLLRYRSRKTVAAVSLGLVPLALWFCFALFYYGFPFPNTAYAKLNTGIAGTDLILQGYAYVKNEFCRSPFTVVVVAGAVFYAAWTRSLRLMAAAVGILLYVAYVVRIGGGYMEGRFFTVPFVAAVALLSQNRFKWSPTEGTAIALTALILALGWPRSPVQVGSDYGTGPERLFSEKGIADERAGYYQHTGLLVQESGPITPHHRWAIEGVMISSPVRQVVRRAGIGMLAYFAGPHLHLVDVHALPDPLLARLPVQTPKKWRIGHFRRDVPEGYLRTLETGVNHIADSSLARYWDKLTLITRGELFSWQRLREIWKFNTGGYDYLLQGFLSQPQRVKYDKFSRPKRQGTGYLAPSNILPHEPGLCVELDGIQHAGRLEISVDSNDEYILLFRTDTTEVGRYSIGIQRIRGGGLRVDTVAVSDEAVQKGYNNVLILPRGGDSTYSVGHLRML